MASLRLDPLFLQMQSYILPPRGNFSGNLKQRWRRGDFPQGVDGRASG